MTLVVTFNYFKTSGKIKARALFSNLKGGFIHHFMILKKNRSNKNIFGNNVKSLINHQLT